MMIAVHFHAIDDARRAGLLGLVKPYLFAISLAILLSRGFGEIGVWLAGPIAELCFLVLTAFLFIWRVQNSRQRWGLFQTSLK